MRLETALAALLAAPLVGYAIAYPLVVAEPAKTEQAPAPAETAKTDARE